MRTAATILVAFLSGYLLATYLTGLRTDLCTWVPMEPIKALDE